MCRFVAYFGHKKILLSKLLSKPENSLIRQSGWATEGRSSINADGFGVAWYDLEIDDRPGIFKSTQPAWNDNNLLHISQKIKSSCFLGHVRASTIGDVTQGNCHPFAFDEYCLVHNGTIRKFHDMKRNLINQLDDDLFLSIKGNTDSECFFFLIMQFLKYNGKDLFSAVKAAINWVVQTQEPLGASHFAKINAVITSGQEMIGIRFASKGEVSLSLYYSTYNEENEDSSSTIISSEPLDGHKAQWKELPENSYIHIKNSTAKISLGPL